LTQPNMIPNTLAIANAKKRLPLNLSNIRTVTYIETVAIAGNDMSIPPDSMTINAPIAMTPIIELLFKISNMFSAVRNDLLMLLTIREYATIMMNR